MWANGEMASARLITKVIIIDLGVEIGLEKCKQKSENRYWVLMNLFPQHHFAQQFKAYNFLLF